MKTKLTTLALVASCFAISAQAQFDTPPTQVEKPTFIKGSFDIRYDSRLNPNAVKVFDTYSLKLNVCDSVIFNGSILYAPIVVGQQMFQETVKQEASISYDINCDVVNPKNTTQTKNIGRIYGSVPVSQEGVYGYSRGNLKIGIYQMGTARGFDAKFDGLAAGRPLFKPKGWVDKAKETLKLKSGKSSGLTVSNYDTMEFRQHVIPSGPVPIYPEIIVNGAMVYDYDRYCWYFYNLTINYTDLNNRNMVDKVSGSIRWVETDERSTTGEGHYEFDVRVNEPMGNEASVFSAADDESAFFETASDVSALTGTMKYVDTFKGDTVVASKVDVNLVGQKLTRQQAMNLCKVIMFSSIVPLNAE